MTALSRLDPTLFGFIQQEAQRQIDHLELIASENYVSHAVLEAQGSILTNKYAEGYPGKRYYGGCEFVDQIERLAIERAQSLFNAAYANVQPHSGSQANAAVYMALLQPGETILGMSLAHGGHLTHGASVNFSGKLYKAVQYGIDPITGLIDYEVVRALAQTHQPKLIVAGFSAYSQVIDWQKFRAIADEVGAYLVVDMAHIAGLVATGLYPSPVSIADVTTSTTHKTLRGPRGGLILAKANPEIEKKLNSAIFPGSQGGPLMHVIAAKAVAFLEAAQPAFKSYQIQVLKNAKKLAEVLTARGFKIVSGNTQNHLLLVDLIAQDIPGKEAEIRLGEAHMTVNKNTVPNDPRSPFITSGLRLGTPALTSRGMQEPEMEKIAHWIADLLLDLHNDALMISIRDQVIQLCQGFPVTVM